MLSTVTSLAPAAAPTPTVPSGRALYAALSGSGLNDTSTKLLAAAAEAFSDKGFHATTTRDIASRAGLSPAGVYVHFASKEDLLFELSRLGHVFARDMLLAAAAAAPSPTAALQALIGGFSRWHAEHHELGRIVQFEFRHLAADHRTEVLALRREIDKVVRDVLATGTASGEFAVEDPAQTALALLSLAVDVARWYSPGVRTTPEQIERSYRALALRLAGATASPRNEDFGPQSAS